MEIEKGFCQCGCGGRTVVAERTDRRQGKVKGEPQRYILGHAARRTLEEYRVDPDTGCWLWVRYVDNAGYGRITRAKPGGSTLAHRVYYERRHGPIPAGLPLDHLCRVPRCVNPDHLEPVPQRVNVHRGIGLKVTDEQIEVAWRAIQCGAGVRETARAIGTTHSTLIRRFKSMGREV
jgi:hypothetical protein